MAHSEPATRERSPDARFPGFDGLRAMAALAVVLTHVAYSGGANAPNRFGIFFARMDGGVAVFFVLSGILLYRPFVRAHVLDEAGPAVRPYFWRRAVRIYPAYWLAMTVIVYGFGATEIQGLRAFVLDYSLLHIYSPHQADAFGPLLQSWTLATEIAFYVFVPIWAALLARLARGSTAERLRAQALGVVVLVAVSAAWKAFVLSAGFSEGRIGQLKMWLPWWLDLFAAGMAIAIASTAITHLGRSVPLRLDRRRAPMLCWIGAVLALWRVAAGVGLGHTTPEIAHHLLWGQHYLYGTVAVLLILPAAFGPQDRDRSRIHWFLQSTTMVFLGTISYGIYLWHEGWIDRYLAWTDLPVFGVYLSDVPVAWHTNHWWSVPWLTFLAVVLVLTIATATASWYALERPILRAAHRRRSVQGAGASAGPR
jgi:peptidoglycan/LPS O-acetylase OafA/YrhL